MITSRKKKLVIDTYKTHDRDTGSAAVQVALLTKRITELTGHLKKHKKDHHSRRGLLKMVGKRRRLLRYLEKHNIRLHNRTIKRLGLKKR